MYPEGNMENSKICDACVLKITCTHVPSLFINVCFVLEHYVLFFSAPWANDKKNRIFSIVISRLIIASEIFQIQV